MKKLLFCLCLMLLGCSDKTDPVIEDIKLIPPDLIGKWKITGVYESESGINPTWREESTTYIYNYWFKTNGEYIRNESYLNGTFAINNDRLTFTLTSTQNSQTVVIERLDSDTMIINWLAIEALKTKYAKVSSEGE